jgi:hypothetical protein
MSGTEWIIPDLVFFHHHVKGEVLLTRRTPRPIDFGLLLCI